MRHTSQVRGVQCEKIWVLILRAIVSGRSTLQLSCSLGICTVIIEFLPQNDPEKNRDNYPHFQVRK